jgi:hypothetical protein
MDKIDQWHMKRRGKFTASEAFKLLAPKKGDELFGAGAWTYIKEKAIEMTTKIWDRPELDQVESLLHGRVHEYPAYDTYVKTTRNTSLTYLGDENPIFVPHPILVDEFGGTPDCAYITEDGRITFGVEIKCPKQPGVHFERLKWKDQFDLKMNYLLCYTQIQSLMMCTGAEEWHFISYDERQILKPAKIKIIEVKPDKIFQSSLELRIKQAIKEKYRIISEYYADYGIVVTNRQEFNEKFHMAA